MAFKVGKRFDPEALDALELVLDVYYSGDPQWAQWATSFMNSINWQTSSSPHCSSQHDRGICH
jgi:hypothetical protein